MDLLLTPGYIIGICIISLAYSLVDSSFPFFFWMKVLRNLGGTCLLTVNGIKKIKINKEATSSLEVQISG